MSRMKHLNWLALLALACVPLGCKREQPPQAQQLRPHEVAIEGAYHALTCGPVTAVFSGSGEGLKNFEGPAPKSYGVESLAFRFADGSERGFAPTGQLFFSDWYFGIFAPDCSHVALLVDHHGPVHLTKLDELRGYLRGQSPPQVLAAPHQTEASVYGQISWVSPSQLDFVTSAGGGAEVWRASFTGPNAQVAKLLAVAEAPKGVRQTAAGWEAVK
jgi:hypothetical protein